MWDEWEKQTACSCNLCESSAITHATLMESEEHLSLLNVSENIQEHKQSDVIFIVSSSPMKMRWGHFSEVLRSREMISCYTTIPVAQSHKPDFGLLLVPPPQQCYVPVWTPRWMLQKNMIHMKSFILPPKHFLKSSDSAFFSLHPSPKTWNLKLHLLINYRTRTARGQRKRPKKPKLKRVYSVTASRNNPNFCSVLWETPSDLPQYWCRFKMRFLSASIPRASPDFLYTPGFHTALFRSYVRVTHSGAEFI